MISCGHLLQQQWKTYAVFITSSSEWHNIELPISPASLVSRVILETPIPPNPCQISLYSLNSPVQKAANGNLFPTKLLCGSEGLRFLFWTCHRSGWKVSEYYWRWPGKILWRHWSEFSRGFITKWCLMKGIHWTICSLAVLASYAAVLIESVHGLEWNQLGSSGQSGSYN